MLAHKYAYRGHGFLAGKIDLLPNTDFVTIQKLKNNLLPPTNNRNNENDCRSLILQTYGSDQFWVRTGVTKLRLPSIGKLSLIEASVCSLLGSSEL